jgi:pyruvyltransferase
VLHYIDIDLAPCVQAAYPDVHMIDVTAEPAQVMCEIARCSTVISSSLHGLVAAEALGIPAAWVVLSDRVAGGTFKFHDYYLGSGRTALNPSTVVEPLWAPRPVYAIEQLIEAFPHHVNTL